MEYNSNGITLEVKHNSVTKFVELCKLKKKNSHRNFFYKM